MRIAVMGVMQEPNSLANPGNPRPSLAILMRHFSPTAGGAEAYAYRLAEQLRHSYRITAFSQTFGPPMVTFPT